MNTMDHAMLRMHGSNRTYEEGSSTGDQNSQRTAEVPSSCAEESISFSPPDGSVPAPLGAVAWILSPLQDSDAIVEHLSFAFNREPEHFPSVWTGNFLRP